MKRFIDLIALKLSERFNLKSLRLEVKHQKQSMYSSISNPFICLSAYTKVNLNVKLHLKK